MNDSAGLLRQDVGGISRGAAIVVESMLKIWVRGVVQGVGFRPFVYRLALEHGLQGWVCNSAGSVDIEVEGPEQALDAFARDLKDKAPPLAWLTEVRVERAEPTGHKGFIIIPSRNDPEGYQPVPPDTALCEDCRRELFDPSDRRFRYPFINCTNCGPRLTIIRDIPYDRPLTTMASFPLCPDCRREYEDPGDRRFHAQPNACPVCGPRLELLDQEGARLEGDPLDQVIAGLKQGKIIAIKGLGGFHLACDATDPEAVALLRARKHRPGKPLAVMIRDLEGVKQRCIVSDQEELLLTSCRSPIVLLDRLEGADIPEVVAPGQARLGVMLPYTPLHHLLLAGVDRPLVMTSGNLSEEPIARDNLEAVSRLEGIADLFLVHNRDILLRCDDSVFQVDLEPRPLRRARGFAPQPVLLARDQGEVLACGAQEKNTFCLTRGTMAFLSPHIGDMENQETLEHFRTTAEHYQALFRVRPRALACDLHPDYLSTGFARDLAGELGLPLLQVQHHHAHVASCLAENQEEGPVIGVAFDGTGLGPDGTIWGGEVMIADQASFKRLVRLEPVPLPGGAAAIKKPARMALACLLAVSEGDGVDLLRSHGGLTDLEAQVVARQVETGLNSPLTSSAGRLFDAAAALLGVRSRVDFEGQAAMELEALASRCDNLTSWYPVKLVPTPDPELHHLSVDLLLRCLLGDLEDGEPRELIARRFHSTLARMILLACRQVRETTGLDKVALSGGVFQNRLLTMTTIPLLRQEGFRVLTHRQVPCNDGGISLGQAAVALARGAVI